MPEKSPHTTRRDVLKLAAATLGSIALTGLTDVFAQGVVSEDPPPFDIATNVTKEFHSYKGEAANIINSIYKRYRIGIFSLKEYNGKPNLSWPTEAIVKLGNTLSKLPDSYLQSKYAPQWVYLVRVPGSRGDGIGGGYASRGVSLTISEEFNLSMPFTGWAKDIYFSTEQYLEGTICHEFTHSYMDGNSLMRFWLKDTGWSQLPSGKWVNSKPEDLPVDLVMHYPEPTPDEDIAISAARMLVNPASLSRSRQLFFLVTPPFSFWQATENFRRSTSGKK